MRTSRDRPGLDRRPLPYPHREMTYCPRCGEQGVMVRFAPDGLSVVQVHVVHEWVTPCASCGTNHPHRVCVLGTWPPTRWMNTPVRLHDPNGPLPKEPE